MTKHRDNLYTAMENMEMENEELRVLLRDKQKEINYLNDLVGELMIEGKEIMKVNAKGHKPTYTNSYAAGLDIRSNETVTIKQGEIKDIKTLLAVEIPAGHFGMVVARSGLSFKYQVKLINDVGIIDEDYRGDIGIRLKNEGDQDYTIQEGDRVAQMIIIPYIQPALLFTDELSETDRGTAGFGSTGR